MPSQSEIQENITARIIEGLQNGIVPWKKPWRNDPNCGSPANVVSRRNYSGINPILLDLAAQANGFTSRFWATYPQWQQLGGQVKKRPDNVKPGHWGTNIVFFRQANGRLQAGQIFVGRLGFLWVTCPFQQPQATQSTLDETAIVRVSRHADSLNATRMDF